MHVCVTGGSGFIGWYMIHALVEAGHTISILDLIEPGADWPEHTFVQGDIRDPSAVRQALQGADAVFNLAAAHHDFGIEDETYHDVNANGSQVICDVMDELNIRRVCFYSTVAVYGDAPPPLTEDTAPKPASPYGKSKLAGEHVFRVWTEQGDGRRSLIIRPTVTFGPRNFANMYSLIRQVDSGRFLFVGKAENIKSLSYVENIVQATMFLLERDDLPAFDVYNYVEKPDFNSRQIASTIYDAFGRQSPRWSIPLWCALTAALPFDLVIALTGKNIPISGARIRKLFNAQTKFEADKVRQAGFEPDVSLSEGITRMVKWFDEQGRDQSAVWHVPPAEPKLSSNGQE